MKSLLILLAEIGAFTLFLRWIYYHFVMPATASKFSWYTDYLQLCDYINDVDSYEGLQHALNWYYIFSGDKVEAANPSYQFCIKQVTKRLTKKHRIYKSQKLTA